MQFVERNKPGKGRRNRVNMSVPTDYEIKLNRLAIACGNMAPTTLAWLLVKHCLDDPQIVALVQMDYAINDDYRIIPSRDYNGGWTFDLVRMGG